MRVLLSSLKVPTGLLINQFPQCRNMANKAASINFNTKHLKTGDPRPPYNGTLRLYNMRYCPYAQRTVLALNAKKIPYEVVNINLIEKPEWLTSVSAFGKVPALEIADGVTIYESLVTVEYLDEVYPQKPLIPKDPVKRAYDKIIIEAIGPVHTLFYKLLKSPDNITDDNIKAFEGALEFVQNQLKKRGDKFLDGNDEPGYVDYMIWPWFERLLIFEKVDKRATINKDKYKLLIEYFNALLKDPAISQYSVPENILLEFLQAYRNNTTPNYDLMLQN